MILFIYRLIILLAIGGGVSYFFISPSNSKVLKSDLELANGKIAKLLLQLEVDKNESEKALSTLYRSRVSFRDQSEERLSEIEGLKSEIGATESKLTEFEKAYSEKSNELLELEAKLVTARAPLAQISEQIAPLEAQVKIVEDSRQDHIKSLSLAKEAADIIEADFRSLESVRNSATNTFDEERRRLMNGIKKPYHVYYSDSKEIEVANRAPSGKGIFINKGYIDGFREGMEFLTNNENARSRLSFRLKAALVQKNFSFLEFLQETQVLDDSFASQGQRLKLTRSGELVENESESSNNSINE